MSGKEKTNGSLAMAPRVITIPAANQETARKLRVAAYTRVSSNSKDQEHSFAAQNAYFSKLITDNPDWELADIYADQGITGTSIDKRDDFLRMMEDCRKGRIDRILVKSSSRFARNTKESLAAVRELKSLNISVYFEEQNIDTAQVSGEVLIAMFAALAQRESEAISERMRWSYRTRIDKGRFSTNKAPFGYMLADATREAAEANPDTKFAIIDDATIDLPNVTSLMFKAEQASYLVGYVAGLTTKTNNIGFVVGMTNETMNQFGYGYCAGAIDANPDITVQQMNANSFADSATGKSMANAEITNGADIVFQAAGATGLGVIEACQEAGVYAIGVDSDQSSIAPNTVLTSAMKRVDNAVYDAVQELIDDKLEGGVQTFDLAAGGVDIAPSQDLISEDVIAAVDEVKEKIISGDVVVPDDKASFEEKYGDVYVLD